MQDVNEINTSFGKGHDELFSREHYRAIDDFNLLYGRLVNEQTGFML